MRCCNLQKTESRQYGPYVYLGLSVIAVSFASLFVRLTTAPPAITAMYRMVVTAVLLAPLVRKTLWSSLRSLSFRQKFGLLLSGFFLALHFLFWMTSVFYTSIASATLLLAFQPIFALIFERILFRYRIRPSLWAYVAMAIFGTAIIGWHDLRVGHMVLLGDLLSLVSASASALYMVAGSGLRKHLSANEYNVSVFFLAAVALFVYSLCRGYSFIGLSMKDVSMTLLLVLVPTVFGHAVFNALLKHLKASTISMSIIGEPIVATLLAYVFLHQALSLWWFVGATVLLLSIILFLRDRTTQ